MPHRPPGQPHLEPPHSAHGVAEVEVPLGGQRARVTRVHVLVAAVQPAQVREHLTSHTCHDTVSRVRILGHASRVTSSSSVTLWYIRILQPGYILAMVEASVSISS